jgi:hypothetical protein
MLLCAPEDHELTTPWHKCPQSNHNDAPLDCVFRRSRSAQKAKKVRSASAVSARLRPGGGQRARSMMTKHHLELVISHFGA